VALGWEEAIAALAEALRRYRPEEIGILASPQMSNEDLFALQRVAAQLGVAGVDHRVPPRVPGDEDNLLIRADKNPNRRGAELIGLGQGDARAILDGARQRRVKLLWIFQHDLLDSGLPAADVTAALAGAEMVVFQGPSANATSAGAHLVLPSAAYVEREGTFTNFQGRVQRFRTVAEPLGEAMADWSILGRIGRALGGTDPAFSAGRAEQVFAGLAGQVPAFSGMSYRGLLDAGQEVKA
jgi:NADH-quinone oxidoreductase subunit G